MNCSIDTAREYAERRKALTGRTQVIYLSQPNHYLWCSQKVWLKSQAPIAGNRLVEVV